VLLLDDPVERQPPQAQLGFASAGERVDLDLSGSVQRARWRDAFEGPRESAVQTLRRAGIGVESLSSDAASDAWLPAFARGRV